MSAYEPPTAIYPIFDSLAFQTPNDASLTIAEGDERYLARKNVATSVATATSFSAEVAAISWTSLNSGATNFHLDNLAGNNAPLIIRNQRTDQNIFYRQLGTTNSHIFQTNGAGTTNLTLSNTANTFSSVPTVVNVTAAGAAVQAFSVRDLTSTQGVVTTPYCTLNFLNPMTALGDCQVLAGSVAFINTVNLVLATWSSTTCGIRITPTQVNIGAGGTTNITPTSGILFNSSAGNATVTGNMTFSRQILSTPGAVISGTVTLALPLNNMYFITAAGAITVTLPTNAAAYTGSRIVFRRTAAGGIITVDQTGGALALIAAGSVAAASSVSIAAATVTFEFVSNGTFWCEL